MKRVELADKHGDELLFLSEDYFDQAIVGVSNEDRVVYDMDKMIELSCKANNWEIDEAIEYLEFNTWGAYAGKLTPIYIQRRY